MDVTRTILHSTSGSVLREVDMATEVKRRTGFGYHRINRVDLVECLRDGARARQVPIHYDKKLVSIVDHPQGESVTVTFSDGSSDTASLLLGCDGIHSTVRRLHVDAEIKPAYSGISAISAIVDDDKPQNETPACLHSTMTPHGMLATAPCIANQTFWFFSKQVALPQGVACTDDFRDGWSVHRQQELADCRRSLDTVLSGVSGQWGQYLRHLVDASQELHFYPHYRLPLGGRWFAPGSGSRVLLMGDAAHAVQPHAGQGVGLALEDVLLLSVLLAQYQDGRYSTLGEVFEQFDAIRRPRITRINEIAQRNGNMRRNQSPWTVWVKEWYMWMMLRVNQFWGLSVSGVLNGDVLYDVEAEL